MDARVSVVLAEEAVWVRRRYRVASRVIVVGRMVQCMPARSGLRRRVAGAPRALSIFVRAGRAHERVRIERIELVRRVRVIAVS